MPSKSSNYIHEVKMEIIKLNLKFEKASKNLCDDLNASAI
jgi:hypothetical protein